MEFRQLIYFMEVAKREHMTEAAEALHVAQSSVSRSIYNLEQELGVNLFIREGRNVRLTSIGKRFYERAAQIIYLMEKSKREINEYLNPNKGTVRIAFPVSMAAYFIPSVISAFQEKYPETKFEMSNGLYSELINGIKHTHYNIAITTPVPEDEPQVESHVLFHEHIVALLPLHHQLAKQKEITLHDLRNEPFIAYPNNFMLQQLITKSFRDVGFEPNIAFTGKDTNAVKGLVAAGLGVALMPELTLINSTPRSTVAVKISSPFLTRPVGVITPTECTLLPTEQLFYDFLKQFSERPDRY